MGTLSAKSEGTNEYEILTTTDLQKRLKIGRDKASALIKSEGFPSIRIGKRYIVTAKALNEWLDNYQYKSFILEIK